MNISGVSAMCIESRGDGGHTFFVYNGIQNAERDFIGSVISNPVIGARGVRHGTTYVCKDVSDELVQVASSLEGAMEALLNARLRRLTAGATG